ncbi:MAG: garR 4 [Rhizobacter sp.]|nr:garR 4 [Rhizobacter sp.]
MKSIGVVGMGIMGGAMARHLAAAGHEVVGFDPSAEAAQRLSASGGTPLASIGEVAARARVIVTSLPSVAAFETAMAAMAETLREGHVVIETSTMPIDVKQRGHDTLAAGGAVLLDCPVSGTGAQAAVKDLVVFGSGDEGAFEAIKPVLQGFSRRQVYLGRFGNGSTMKFIANHLVNIHNVAAAEAFALAGSAGLDLQSVYDTLQDSAGSSRMFQVRGPLMVAGQYDEPTARIEMYMKDLDVITSFAAGLRCPTPLFTAATQLYYTALNRGQGALDTASVCTVLEEMAGIKRSTPST